MSRYSNLAVKNATKAAQAAIKTATRPMTALDFETIFNEAFEDALAKEPEENFKTGVVYDALED